MKPCIKHNYINVTTIEDKSRGNIRFRCLSCEYIYIRKELKGENVGKNSSI